MNIIERIRMFLYKSQEFTLWLPGLVVLAVLGYVVLGGIVRVGPDALAWLAELPALCAYAAAALAFSWAVKGLYLHDIDRAEERRLHHSAEEGHPGARWILIKDRLETLACIVVMLLFFWPAR